MEGEIRDGRERDAGLRGGLGDLEVGGMEGWKAGKQGGHSFFSSED